MSDVSIEIDQNATLAGLGRRQRGTSSHADAGVSLVKSAGRVFQILELFDELQTPLRVSQLVEHLNVPQSSTSALLKCMVQLGYLSYEPARRTFFPTERVAILGAWLDRSDNLLQTLDGFAADIGHTVVLSARNGLYAQHIHVIAPSKHQVYAPRGSRRPLVWSESGFALLTRSSDNEIRLLCARTNAERPAGEAIVPVRRVLECVSQVRQHGYFFSEGSITPGFASASILLPSAGSRRTNPLAVTLVCPLNEMDEHGSVQSLRGLRQRLCS